MTAKVFISYRRDDSAGYAGRLYDGVSERFGHANVFMDVLLPAGEDFVAKIEEAVASCDVLVAMIGREWLTVLTRDGGRRLDDPEDFPRIEIAAALSAGVPVIPVLVAGAEMPAPDDLPDGLDALARRQAHELSDSRWDYDLGQLVRHLERLSGGESVEPRPAGSGPRGRWAALAGAGALVVFGGAAALGALGGDDRRQAVIDRRALPEARAFRSDVGKICARRNTLQKRRRERFPRYRRALNAADTLTKQRNAIIGETQERFGAAAHLNSRLRGLAAPKAMESHRRAVIAAWNRNIERLRLHRDRLGKVSRYDEFLGVLAKVDRSVIDRDVDRVEAGLTRLGGSSCDLDPLWEDPVLDLKPPKIDASAPSGESSGAGASPSLTNPQTTPGPQGTSRPDPTAPSLSPPSNLETTKPPPTPPPISPND